MKRWDSHLPVAASSVTILNCNVYASMLHLAHSLGSIAWLAPPHAPGLGWRPQVRKRSAAHTPHFAPSLPPTVSLNPLPAENAGYW